MRVESLKARVEIQKYEFESNPRVDYEFEFMSHEFESTSYEFESTISRIMKNSMKAQVNSPKIISSQLFGNS